MAGNGPEPCGRKSSAWSPTGPLEMTTVSDAAGLGAAALTSVGAIRSNARTSAYGCGTPFAKFACTRGPLRWSKPSTPIPGRGSGRRRHAAHALAGCSDAGEQLPRPAHRLVHQLAECGAAPQHRQRLGGGGVRLRPLRVLHRVGARATAVLEAD